MQHQVTNLVVSLDGSPPVLAGAAVEGPNSFAAIGVVNGMKTFPVNGVDQFAPFNSGRVKIHDAHLSVFVFPSFDNVCRLLGVANS
jgi:hypothetical protein